APTHSSSIQPSGKILGIGAQLAVPKLLGKPEAKPTNNPIFSAVIGPGPSVCRDQAYKWATMIPRMISSTVHCRPNAGYRDSFRNWPDACISAYLGAPITRNVTTKFQMTQTTPPAIPPSH